MPHHGSSPGSPRPATQTNDHVDRKPRRELSHPASQAFVGLPDRLQPVPSISGHTQIAYRWLNITWTGPSDYLGRYTVEWRRKKGTEWKTLTETPTSKTDRSRARIVGHSADLRGLPYEQQPAGHKNIVVRVVGRTAAGLSATSKAYDIARFKPDAKGHQRDHAVGYDLSELPNSTPGSRLVQKSRAGCGVCMDDGVAVSVGPPWK